ncbi:DUF2207 domain-containing protein [Paenibacillus sp. GCM10027626]|uniref:DUF2207 domain-containing protein n=1 Tax=Paenibacillus sp. GCM10027626 TaxID=3273411 RepID=UPI00363D3847
MRRKLLPLFLVICLAAIMTGCSESRSYTIDQVDINAYVEDNGDLYVEELFTYTFQGEFNGVKRFLPEDKTHLFFEAYLAPEGKGLGTFSYDSLEQLPVEYDEENETYYIANREQDRTQRFIYRYRIESAAVRHADYGELKWAFLERNDQKLNQVHLNIFLSGAFAPGSVQAFLRDRSGGRIIGMDKSIRYHNEVLSENGDAEIRLFFPSRLLAQMPQDEAKVNYSKELEAEQSYQLKLGERMNRLELADDVLDHIAIALFAAAVLLLLSPLTILVWLQRGKYKQAAEQSDPLMAAYLLRKGRLLKRDFAAGLFSLHRRGLITVQEIEMNERLLHSNAPDTTLKFAFTGDIESLHEADQRLVRWLFTRRGKSWTCRLDNLVGATKEERIGGRRQAYYINKGRRFHKGFEQWEEAVTESAPFNSSIWPNKGRKWAVIGLIIFHWLAVTLLYKFDLASAFAFWAATLAAGVCGIFAAFKHRKKKYAIIYFLLCCVIESQIVGEVPSGSYGLVALTSILLVFLLPQFSISWEARCLRVAVAGQRRAWHRNRINADRYETEQLAELLGHAFVLGYGAKVQQKLYVRYGQAGSEAAPDSLSLNVEPIIMYTQRHLLSSGRKARTGDYYSSGTSASSSSSSSSSDGGGTGAY